MLQRANVSLTRAYLEDAATGIRIDANFFLTDLPVDADDIEGDIFDAIREQDVHAYCPHCLDDKNYKHRLSFRDRHNQPIRGTGKEFEFPRRFATWENGKESKKEHRCHLQERLQAYKSFTINHSRLQNSQRDEPVFVYNVNIDCGREAVVTPVRSYRGAFREANGKTPRPNGTSFSRPRSKGVKSIEFFAKFIRMAEENPMLMDTQFFRDPPRLLPAREVIFNGNERLFHALLGESLSPVDAGFKVMNFKPLPGNLWPQYRGHDHQWVIPGRSKIHHHGVEKFYVGQRLIFKTEEEYKAAISVMNEQRKQKRQVGLLVGGYPYVSQRQYEQVLRDVSSSDVKSGKVCEQERRGQIAFNLAVGESEGKLNRTVWIDCKVNRPDQFMDFSFAEKPTAGISRKAKAPSQALRDVREPLLI